MNLKPANAKVWALFRKLQALAERGIDGEKTVAERKLALLKARFDFGVPDGDSVPDFFSGKFARSSKARRIYSFNRGELDVANSVKWAIESATKIDCLHRGSELLAETTPTAARRLNEICDHIAQSFRVLLAGFCGLDGVTAADRSAFLMGLYDGMMNETRSPGQRLPGWSPIATKRGGKKSAAAGSGGVHVHPYTIAVSLGKQIRFSAPMEQIVAELEAVSPKLLSQKRH